MLLTLRVKKYYVFGMSVTSSEHKREKKNLNNFFSLFTPYQSREVFRLTSINFLIILARIEISYRRKEKKKSTNSSVERFIGLLGFPI